MSGLVSMAIDRYVNLVDSISGEWYDTQTLSYNRTRSSGNNFPSNASVSNNYKLAI
jgi:hypothetical protein